MNLASESALSSPYTPEELASNVDARLASMGLSLPAGSELVAELMKDLDESVLGIRWWADVVPEPPRAFLSDYLVSAVSATGSNMGEAYVHLLEMRRVNERQEANLKRNAEWGVSPMQPLNRDEDLDHWRRDAHLAGFFRAVGSALDCLAASVVVILPLAMSVRLVDWGRLLSTTGKHAVPAWANEALASIGELKNQAGPPNWFEWTIKMRNVYVHRARPVSFLVGEVYRSGLALPLGYVPGIQLFEWLPREPGLSTAERKGTTAIADLVLTEDSMTTTEGVLQSALSLVDGTCRLLGEVWRARRDGSLAINQPFEDQWICEEPVAFDGYAPNSHPLRAGMMMMNPQLVKRLKAAGLIVGPEGS